jgi:prevent-host-death family protein
VRAQLDGLGEDREAAKAGVEDEEFGRTGHVRRISKPIGQASRDKINAILTSLLDQSNIFLMREVQASDAKARLAELLTAVERGETIVITRHGRRIARLAPETSFKRAEIERAIDDLARFRESAGKAPLAEVLSARHRGHKY